MEIDEEEIVNQSTKNIVFKNAVRRMSGQPVLNLPDFKEENKTKFHEINARVEAMVQTKLQQDKANNMNIPSSLQLFTYQKNLLVFCAIMTFCIVILLLTTIHGHSSKTLQVFRILCLIILCGFNMICISRLYIFKLTITKSTKKVYLREGFIIDYLRGKSYYWDFDVDDIVGINIQQLEGEKRDGGKLYRNCIHLYEKEKPLYTLYSDQKSNVLQNTSKIYRYLSLLKKEGYLKSHLDTESKGWLKNKLSNILSSMKTSKTRAALNSFAKGNTKEKDIEKKITFTEKKIAKAS